MDTPRQQCPQGSHCLRVRRGQCNYWHSDCPHGTYCINLKKLDCEYFHPPHHYPNHQAPSQIHRNINHNHSRNNNTYHNSHNHRNNNNHRNNTYRSSSAHHRRIRPENDNKHWTVEQDEQLWQWMQNHNPQYHKSQANLQLLCKIHKRSAHAIEVRMDKLNKLHDEQINKHRNDRSQNSNNGGKTTRTPRRRPASVSMPRCVANNHNNHNNHNHNRVNTNNKQNKYDDSSDDDISVQRSNTKRDKNNANNVNNTNTTNIGMVSNLNNNSQTRQRNDRQEQMTERKSLEGIDDRKTTEDMKMNVTQIENVSNLFDNLLRYYKKDNNKYEIRNINNLKTRINDANWKGDMKHLEEIVGVGLQHFERQLKAFEDKYGKIDKERKKQTVQVLNKIMNKYKDEIKKIEKILKDIEEKDWFGNEEEFKNITGQDYNEFIQRLKDIECATNSNNKRSRDNMPALEMSPIIMANNNNGNNIQVMRLQHREIPIDNRAAKRRKLNGDFGL